MTKRSLLVVATHPIQYQVPLYQRLARSASLDLFVLFITDFGLQTSFDPGFGADVAFDTPLTQGYEHQFCLTAQRTYPRRTSLPPRAYLSALLGRQYDVVLVNGYATVSAWTTCLLATARRRAYVMRGETQWESDIRLRGAKRLLKRAVLGPLLRGAGASAAIGERNRHFYESYGVEKDRIFIAPYSVDTDKFAADGAAGRAFRGEMLTLLGLDANRTTVLFAGKLQAHKRPQDVLLAAQTMADPPNVLIIGQGPMSRDIEELAGRLSTARCLGFKNQSEIGRWYGASDIIVLPSCREPWGLVVNEAMAAGAVPIVSSAVGCGDDLAIPGIGHVYPVGDVRALAAAIESAMTAVRTDDNIRDKCRAQSEQCSIEQTAAGIEQAVERAARGRRPGPQRRRARDHDLV